MDNLPIGLETLAFDIPYDEKHTTCEQCEERTFCRIFYYPGREFSETRAGYFCRNCYAGCLGGKGFIPLLISTKSCDLKKETSEVLKNSQGTWYEPKSPLQMPPLVGETNYEMKLQKWQQKTSRGV
jgi:hypothetical protein